MDKENEAKRLGTEAFSMGINAPALDDKMLTLMAGSKVGESTHLLKAWMNGWTQANLKAELDGFWEFPRCQENITS